MRFLENGPIAYTKTITAKGNSTVERRMAPVVREAQNFPYANKLTEEANEPRHVTVLPPVPTVGWDRVIWDLPLGDGQVWEASGLNTSTGGNYWYPTQFWTSRVGTPGT